jgi:hypothetical protein
MAIGDINTDVYAEAAARLEGWATQFDAVADPLRRAARVMAAMAHVMARVLETQTLAVTRITDRMAIVNDVLDAANRGLTSNKAALEGDAIRWLESTSREKIDLIAMVLRSETEVPETPETATIYGGWFWIRRDTKDNTNPADDTWYIQTNRRDLTGISDSLQIAVEKLGSSQQNDQTRIQTAVGRYNATFELVSSLIKKSETQADSVGNNLRG